MTFVIIKKPTNIHQSSNLSLYVTIAKTDDRATCWFTRGNQPPAYADVREHRLCEAAVEEVGPDSIAGHYIAQGLAIPYPGQTGTPGTIIIWPPVGRLLGFILTPLIFAAGSRLHVDAPRRRGVNAHAGAAFTSKKQLLEAHVGL
ncbi:hypothetical protein GGTG_11801 [Gaeumannomyces tritici R3-111a-1]|uniref:Uncharacterized protein n=1 Tax=Gaeumannomyces tritici (strain R3-111a-1) TaxID=644352 RepID=J3PE78_GAET3|nr:hypothetical protein GGTG_11801 [Gaeumannomyces tritici R3-111a-1]EJT70778.1 hypothetical protein GGTG_11801 [Gaeumannomyces tritici R3-111a-1]